MRVRLALVVSCCLVGCDVGDDPGGPRTEKVDVDDAISVVAEAITAERSMALPAAGWIDHEDSPITPWCGAVLVAPDVVVTAAICVDGWDPRFFDVGFGPVDAPHHAVDEIVIQTDAASRELALAALHLAEPVTDVTPADLTEAPDSCDVHSAAYRYVARGDASARWLWAGCTEAGMLMARAEASPNCHGDMGSGGFLTDGSLVGVAIDAWFRTEETGDPFAGCADGHRLATVAENAAFFDRALDLSR